MSIGIYSVSWRALAASAAIAAVGLTVAVAAWGGPPMPGIGIPGQPVTGIDESPDGKYVAIVVCDNSLRIPKCSLIVYRYDENGSLVPMPGFTIPGGIEGPL